MRVNHTRQYLIAGLVSGPLFISVALSQAFTREGFDIAKHPVSSLSHGELGWIQVFNFLISGLLVLAGSAGIKQILNSWRGGKWVPVLVGIFGASLIAGGIFAADEGLGFPPGAPEGFPVTMSVQGTIHGFAPMVGFTALIISFLMFARYFFITRQHAWMTLTMVISVGVIGLFLFFNITFDHTGSEFNPLPLWAAIIIGFGWYSVIAGKLRTMPEELLYANK